MQTKLKIGFATTLVTSLLMTSASLAGDNGGGTIQCQTKSGRTQLKGTAGASHNGVGHAQIELSIDGKKLNVGNQDTGLHQIADDILVTDAVIFEPTKKVFTLKFIAINSAERFDFADTLLKLVGDPASMKINGQSQTASFKAKLTSVDPRTQIGPGKWQNSIHVYQLQCELDFGL